MGGKTLKLILVHEKLQRLIIGVSGQEHGLSMHSPLPSTAIVCSKVRSQFVDF